MIYSVFIKQLLKQLIKKYMGHNPMTTILFNYIDNLKLSEETAYSIFNIIDLEIKKIKKELKRKEVNI